MVELVLLPWCSRRVFLFLVYKTRVINTLSSLLFRVFLIKIVGGLSKRLRKYKIDASWPMMRNECLTGCPPTHINVSRSATSSSQNKHWLRGQNIMLCCFDIWTVGLIARIRIEILELIHHITYWGDFEVVTSSLLKLKKLLILPKTTQKTTLTTSYLYISSVLPLDHTCLKILIWAEKSWSFIHLGKRNRGI